MRERRWAVLWCLLQLWEGSQWMKWTQWHRKGFMCIHWQQYLQGWAIGLPSLWLYNGKEDVTLWLQNSTAIRKLVTSPWWSGPLWWDPKKQNKASIAFLLGQLLPRVEVFEGYWSASVTKQILTWQEFRMLAFKESVLCPDTHIFSGWMWGWYFKKATTKTKRKYHVAICVNYRQLSLWGTGSVMGWRGRELVSDFGRIFPSI